MNKPRETKNLLVALDIGSAMGEAKVG